MNLPKGAPLGFGEICVDFWDFERGAPEVVFLLLLILMLSSVMLKGYELLAYTTTGALGTGFRYS